MEERSAGAPGSPIVRPMSVMRLFVLPCVIAAAWPSVSRAEHTDEPAEEPIAARAPADDDAFTPGLTHSVAHGRGIMTGVVSLNGASKTTTVDLNGEVKVFGPVRLVLRVDNVFDKARPGIGAAVQWLDERKHGVSSSAYFVFKTEGFTEIEGEFEGLVSFGKQLGPVHGTLNLAYGQDPEGNERDGEAALGLHVEPIRGLFTGVVGRYRDALGSKGDKGTGILRDALGGATATYVLGNFGVTATAGIAGIETTTSGSMQAGAEAALSVGAVF
jgi:hypothetical protein